MVKRMSFNHLFDRVNDFKSQNSLDEQKAHSNSKFKVEQVDTLPHPSSPRGEEREFNVDPVQIEPGLSWTLSTADPVHNEPPHGGCDDKTGFIANPVHHEPCANQTGSTVNPIQNEPCHSKSHNKGFTAVPNDLLRIAGLFEDPLDFMLYLHFYTYSYGFGRDTASMGQTQLEKFAGVSRNRIRRSLERLEAAKWIRIFSEFSAGQVTRSWKVTPPEKKMPDPSPKKTGSKKDPVHHEPSPPRTPRGSNLDTRTGSTVNPYKESISKKVLKKSLSGARNENLNFERLPDRLMRYFNELSPKAKLESEWRAFSDLQSEFQPEEIEAAFTWLKRHGLPDSGKPAHSPMGFLKFGISQVNHQIAKSSFKLVSQNQQILGDNNSERSYDNVATNLSALRIKLQTGGACA